MSERSNTTQEILELIADLPPSELEEVRQFINFIRYKLQQSLPESLSSGWPTGFFEQTFGSLPGLAREPQGEYEARDPLE